MLREAIRFCKSNRPYISLVIVKNEEGEYLLIHSKPIAFKGAKKVQLSTLWDYSCMTAKFTACFLDCRDPEEVKQKIESKEYELVDEVADL